MGRSPESEPDLSACAGTFLTQYYEYNKTLVYHQRVRLHRRGGIVERVGVLRRLTLQLALVGEGTSTAITEESAKKKWLNLFILSTT